MKPEESRSTSSSLGSERSEAEVQEEENARPGEDAQPDQDAIQDGAAEASSEAEEKPPYKPYSRKTRIKAWIGVAFMIFLVLMYTYSLASGKIMEW